VKQEENEPKLSDLYKCYLGRPRVCGGFDRWPGAGRKQSPPADTPEHFNNSLLMAIGACLAAND
jgi:hypothetical protein